MALNRFRRGFSLVEALVAIFLITLTFGFIFAVFPKTARALSNSRNHVNAAEVGGSILDRTAALDFDTIAAGSGSVSFSGKNNGITAASEYDYVLSVQSIDSDRKYLWVTVSWDEGGHRKNVVLETIVTKR